MICFHIGYPKAGSTTLQKALFSRHSQLVNIGIYPQSNVGRDTQTAPRTDVPILSDASLREFHRLCIHADGIALDEQQLFRRWELLKSEYLDGDKTLILSNEGFLSGRFANPEIIEKLRRLSILEPHAKVLVIFRNQVDILKSLYRDHPFDPRTLEYHPRPVSFREFLEIDLARPHHNHTNTLFFYKLSRRLSQWFNAKNILFLPLEQLREEPIAFSDKLANFMGIDNVECNRLLTGSHENKGPTLNQNRYRHLRQIIGPLIVKVPFIRQIAGRVDRKLNNLVKKMGSTQSLSVGDFEYKLIRDNYGRDNKQLSESIHLPLDSWGYVVEE